ncbi:hypothetical protein IJJ12_01415 [bacterium]|nr:hypothetical protein [bacterium]
MIEATEHASETGNKSPEFFWTNERRKTVAKLLKENNAEIYGLRNETGEWLKKPMKLVEANYGGRIGVVDNQLLDQDVIKADLQDTADLAAKDSQERPDTKRLATIFEYTVASELAPYTDKGGTRGTESVDWLGEYLSDSGAIVDAKNYARVAQVFLTSEYDDRHNHADGVFIRASESGKIPEAHEFIGFSFDATFTDDYEVMYKKFNHEMKRLRNEKDLLPVKYIGWDDVLQPTETVSQEMLTSQAGRANLPRFILSVSKQEAYDFASTLDEEKSEQMGKILLVEMLAEAFVMAKMTDKMKKDFSPLATSPLRQACAQERAAYHYLKMAMRKRALSEVSALPTATLKQIAALPEANQAKTLCVNYLHSMPKTEQSQRIVAFYLTQLRKVYESDEAFANAMAKGDEDFGGMSMYEWLAEYSEVTEYQKKERGHMARDEFSAQRYVEDKAYRRIVNERLRAAQQQQKAQQK